ncbi:polysaccharide deacetylase family protein [Spiribacter sp. 218]|uniref:polysaccharide deacetylase family protein n=1 Tax=Spiribacter pallidus TaxID=1987936 RepID=UPI00349F4105
MEYFCRFYNFVSIEQVIRFFEDGIELPANPLLLTFDDGYKEHYTYVYPELRKKGVQGAFFVPAGPVEENVVLDVNKIHYVLASAPCPNRLLQHVLHRIDRMQVAYQLERTEQYLARTEKSTRFDDEAVGIVKALLQKELPWCARKKITDDLFREHVTEEEASFARELYMNKTELNEMERNGMFIGGHGADHYWLDSLNRSEQQREVERTVEFLTSLNRARRSWVMCYPFGAYDESVLEILRRYGFQIGLSTKVGLTALNDADPMALERLDANDFPKGDGETPNKWTRMAAGWLSGRE